VWLELQLGGEAIGAVWNGAFMNTTRSRVARSVVALAVTVLLAGCVSPPRPDGPVDLDFTQYQFDPVDYEAQQVPSSGIPLAAFSDDRTVLTVRQLGSPGCETEPVSFEQEDGGSSLRVTYEFVEPNPEGLCNTAAAFYGTDIPLDEGMSKTLRTAVLVGPFRNETTVSIESV
jgi:hypothetical protein